MDDRETPPEIFDPLERQFHFTLDVAASDRNHKCDVYLTRKHDGLAKPWIRERVWCNPPYSSIRPWVEKAWREQTQAEVIVMLLPANRTEQGWWQELVEPYRDNGGYLQCQFLPSRPRFLGHQTEDGEQRPPFGCCLLIWRPFGHGAGPLVPVPLPFAALDTEQATRA